MALCAAVALGLTAGPRTAALPLPVAAAAECAGDECQGPAPAPEEVTPGTAVVEGPANPPARFPTHHKKRHGKKHPHHRHSEGGR